MAFRIVRNDITQVKADAIVNSANPEPICAGGSDKAIYEAAGKELLLTERQRIGRLKPGQAAATPAFALQARYIIHTVGPSWEGGDEGEFDRLRECYENCLMIAQELGCESIAFPLISTGVYGFPKAEALQIAVEAISAFLLEYEMKVILVVFDPESFVLSGRLFAEIDSYIDDKTAEEKRKEEHFGGVYGAMQAFPHGAVRRQESAMAIEEEAVEAAMDEECAAVPHSETLEERMAHLADTWQEALLWWIDQKGFTDVEVYKRANCDRKLFSKIRSKEEYQPKKMTAVAFALALQLNLDETQDLLKRAGYALSHSNKFDMIIEYFIEQGIYDTYTINLALFDHKQPLLGE